MKDRIRKIRKDAGLTQEQFAKELGTVQNTITGYETGRRNPSGSATALMCERFGANLEWLRDGIGNPYIELPKDDTIAKATRLLGKKDPIFESIINTFGELSDSDREVLLKVGKMFFKNLDSKTESL